MVINVAAEGRVLLDQENLSLSLLPAHLATLRTKYREYKETVVDKLVAMLVSHG